MVCDKAARDAHASVFAPNAQAVFYESLDDAIELMEYYLAHPEERLQIARRGFERFWRDYTADANLLKFPIWACATRKDSATI